MRLYTDQIMTDKESDQFEKTRDEVRCEIGECAVQYGVAICIGRRLEKMAGGEERHSLEWPKRRLPHQSAFRRWRATVFHVGEQAERHAAGFYHSTKEVGLEIHPNKTNIVSNQDTRRQKEVTIDTIKVEVLPKNR